MNPCLRILPLVFVFGACTVPEISLDGLGCDETHPCVAGYFCEAGTCVPGSPKGSDDCSEGETRACAASEEVCEAGVQRCGPDGKFLTECEGRVAKSVEVCDGRDNDCDGSIDEGLQGELCEKQEGVCAGARQACRAGALEQTCSAETYRAFAPDYQEVESTCDGLDNDCDGRIDNTVDDADGDGFGATGGGCKVGSDCDDTDEERNPGLVEICDGKDNDCDNVRDEGFACVKGADSGPCTSTCGTAGRLLCNDTCSGTSCVPPAEICNGLDEDCVGGPDNGLISGPILINGPDSQLPAIVGRENGGFSVHVISQPKNSPELSLVTTHFKPDATLGTETSGAIAAVSVKALAATSNHVAWIRQGQGTLQSVDAAHQGASFPVAEKAGSGYSRLDAFSAGASTFLAWQETISSAPLAPEIGLAVLTAGEVTRATSIKPAGGLGYGAPAFGQVGAGTVLYYVRTDSTGHKIALREVDSTGTPGAEVAMVAPPEGTSATQPAAARDALVFAETTGNNSSVVLARVQSSGCGGEPYCLGPAVTVSQAGAFAETPSIAFIGDDTYLIAWRELINFDYIIQVLRIHWDGAAQKWGPLTSRQGLDFRPDRSVLAVRVGHDGHRFALAFETLDTAGNREVYVRNTCP